MATILVIAELDNGKLRSSTYSAVAFARQALAASAGKFEVLLIGERLSDAAKTLQHCGAATVLIADHPSLKWPVADKFAQVIAHVARQRGATMIVAAASTFAKDILPRAAALLDAGMVSDVVEVRRDGEEFTFKRVMFAGNVIATVKLEGAIQVLTVRASAFAPAPEVAESSPATDVAIGPEELPAFIEFGARETRSASRPDSTEACIVVSGGRAIKNAEDFERLVGGLADVLGAAVGSSRVLVDSGITPNSLQVGQTGKIVAPELYIAVGISGAIQHLAGMKDTKIIVAINKDPDAPIFEVADYGLVADVYTAVPELTEKLKR